MTFEDVFVGDYGEALDENGVWFPCRIEEKTETLALFPSLRGLSTSIEKLMFLMSCEPKLHYRLTKTEV